MNCMSIGHKRRIQMNRKQRRANKVKAYEDLGNGMVSLPKNVGLASDKIIMPNGFTKVRFPVNDYGRQRGIEFERMWVKVSQGDSLNGIGVLDNEPGFSDFKLGQIVKFEEDEDGFPRFKA